MRFSIRQLIGAILVLFILAEVVTFISISRSTESEVLAGMRQVMDNVAAQSSGQSESFFDASESVAALTAATIEDGLVTGEDGLELFFLEALRANPALSGVFYGQANGDFFFVNRSDRFEEGGFRTKWIDHAGGQRTVSLTWRSGHGDLVHTAVDPDDAYDPRTRPWFEQAAAVTNPIWTDPYVFFSAQVPGVTTAVAVRDEAGELAGVVGVDVELAALSEFLGGLQLGAGGSAFIVTSDGALVALPDAGRLPVPDDQGGLRLVSISEAGGSEAAATFAAFGDPASLSGPGNELIEFEWDGTRRWAVFETLPSTGWTLGVQVDEGDFVGGIRSISQRNAVITLLATGLFVVLGAGLVRNVTQPLQALRRRAAAVKQGRLQPGPPVPTRIRELRATARAFDAMVEGLRLHERHNIELRDSLEDRVADRTAELTREVAERQAAEASADDANRAKSAFLANMSHEMRTPLNAVLGLTELMKMEALGPMGDPRYGEYASDIHEAGTHLLALINDILDLARIEAGKLELTEESVELAEAAATAVRMVSHFADQRGVTISSRVPAALGSIWADDRRVRQMIINLVNNAVKFTPAGGTVDVTAAEAVDGSVSISVADTGIGMSPDEIAVAMTPFGQVETSESATEAGSGLGIPITRRLIEAHGGTLQIESEPGSGTTVSLSFPGWRRGEPLADSA
ncbi:MAG: HAMP domain-containing protein [Acidimicrobiia bacterium]|nr:HAMP domain-containing protein [Acidimicrobiia bacterium]MBT8216290.1 HAMP domain-containing protein [Acidimicrobiia bacterium]NNF10361.1 HAMP domain-containing protein [Acidimicrobiia bacterium]NNL71525.1 HAMP domain-containing protein [Acidimicrobiia bacterium]